MQGYPSFWHSHSSHFLIPQRTGTSRWLNICLCDDRSPYILRLFSLPFYEREKIPHQFVFHFQLLYPCILSSQLVAKIGKLIFFCYYAIFRRATFLLDGYSCGYFSLFFLVFGVCMILSAPYWTLIFLLFVFSYILAFGVPIFLAHTLQCVYTLLA